MSQYVVQSSTAWQLAFIYMSRGWGFRLTGTAQTRPRLRIPYLAPSNKNFFGNNRKEGTTMELFWRCIYQSESSLLLLFSLSFVSPFFMSINSIGKTLKSFLYFFLFLVSTNNFKKKSVLLDTFFLPFWHRRYPFPCYRFVTKVIPVSFTNKEK